NTYGRDFASDFRDTSPTQTTMMIAIGTWNASPNANSMPIVKSRYDLMSVITITPFGATLVKKLNAIGSTRKNANATPTENRIALAMMNGSAIRRVRAGSQASMSRQI